MTAGYSVEADKKKKSHFGNDNSAVMQFKKRQKGRLGAKKQFFAGWYMDCIGESENCFKKLKKIKP